jgi:hypothetical protein
MNNPNDGSYFGFSNQQYLGQGQQQQALLQQQQLLQQSALQRAQGVQPGVQLMNPALFGGIGGNASALQ